MKLGHSKDKKRIKVKIGNTNNGEFAESALLDAIRVFHQSGVVSTSGWVVPRWVSDLWTAQRVPRRDDLPDQVARDRDNNQGQTR